MEGLGKAMEAVASGLYKPPPREYIAKYVDSKFRLTHTVEMLEKCYEKARQFAYFRGLSG